MLYLCNLSAQNHDLEVWCMRKEQPYWTWWDLSWSQTLFIWWIHLPERNEGIWTQISNAQAIGFLLCSYSTLLLCHYFNENCLCGWVAVDFQHPKMAATADGAIVGAVASSCLVRGNLANVCSSRPWNMQPLLIPHHARIPNNPGLIPNWFQDTPS